MVAQVVAILVLILGRHHMQQFFVVGKIALWVATIAALVSAVDYSRRINVLLARPAAPPPGPVLASSRRRRAGARSGQCLILIVAIRALAFWTYSLFGYTRRAFA